MDPLVVLQEYVAGRRGRRDVTTESGSFVIFDDVAYAKDAKTSLYQYGKTTIYYTLESILYLWDNRQLQHAIYVKNASGAGIMAVTRADRREMLDYLKGDRTNLPSNHDPLAPLSSTIPLSMFADMEGPERKKPKLDPSLVKAPRIDHLLNDGPSLQTQQETEEIRDLNEQLTADKIAALRMKRKNNQRKNITHTFDDSEMAAPETSVSMDRDLRERVWRTRANCLEASTKNFNSILNLLQSLKTREEAKQRSKNLPLPSSAPPKNATEAARQAAANRSRTAGYSRYDQEQFQSGEASEFGVDAAQATFVGQSLTSFMQKTSTPGSSRGPPPSTPSTTTTPSNPLKPISTPRNNMTTPSTPDSSKPHKRTSRTPIIIIPSATSSLITMYNVKDILQDIHFVTTEEKKAAGQRRENECLLQRRKGDVTVPYRVVDNPMKLTNEEWERVVAVFAMGPAWQFKGWQFNGNPTDILAHIAGFHIAYDDMKIDPNIAKWSVTVIQLNRTKRHLDKARIVKFWDVLDRHIVKTKPYLRY